MPLTKKKKRGGKKAEGPVHEIIYQLYDAPLCMCLANGDCVHFLTYFPCGFYSIVAFSQYMHQIHVAF